LYFAEIITLLAMKNKRYYRGHLDNWRQTFAPPWRNWGRNACVFLRKQYKWDIAYETNWQTTGQGLNNSTHVSTVALWNETDTFTSFASFTSQTTIMGLAWGTKFLTGYGRCEICLKFETRHFQNFKSPLNMWLQTKLLFYLKEGSFWGQYMPKIPKRFGVKIYKPCDESGYTYDMTV
jgi:hypothetical protein